MFGARFTAKVGNVIYDVTRDISNINSDTYRTFSIELYDDKEKLSYSIGYGDPIIKDNVLYYPLHIPYTLLLKFNNIPANAAILEQLNVIQTKKKFDTSSTKYDNDNDFLNCMKKH